MDSSGSCVGYERSLAMAARNDAGNRTQIETRNQTKSLLKAGLDALGFGFAVFDIDLRLVAHNKAFRKLRDYPARLCKPGTPIQELYRFNAKRGDYGPGDIESQIEASSNRARSRRFHELEYKLATGRTLSIRYTPIAEGGLLLSYVDVTERRKAEDALRESEERYTLAMEGANEGMWYWRNGGNDFVISDSYRRIVGLDFEGDRLALADWEALIHPEDRGIREAARRSHLNGETEFYECEYRVRCGDGEYRWFLDRARSICDEAGEIYRMVGSLADVTARKAAEQELRAANRRIDGQNQKLEALSGKLSKYLSPQIYSSIFEGRQSGEISAKRRKLTVCFSDIADFTAITESLEPEELTGLLNDYLTEMSAIALEYGGTIDKYMGDAMIVFFGDPDSKGAEEDAKACVSMAIAMQRRMRQLQRERRDRGLEWPFHIRIGISTGFCTVGNFGSPERMEYTIIGNAVNLAARLEYHADVGGILLAHQTYSLVKDTILAEEQDAVSVKGFARPIPAYRVVGGFDELAEQHRIVRVERDGLRLFIDLDKFDRSSAIETIESYLGKKEQ